jgi:hypothetical protein
VRKWQLLTFASPLLNEHILPRTPVRGFFLIKSACELRQDEAGQWKALTSLVRTTRYLALIPVLCADRNRNLFTARFGGLFFVCVCPRLDKYIVIFLIMGWGLSLQRWGFKFPVAGVKLHVVRVKTGMLGMVTE